MKRYKKPEPKWPWRDYLTDDERATLARADAAKAAWQKLNKGRAEIQNRALQRAKYAAQACR
jgi:hypothetical protein